MERTTPWIIAAVCAVIGGGVWFYRAQGSSADSRPLGSTVVAHAWDDGRKVALRGRQQIKMSEPGEAKTVTVNAEVIHSRDGKMRIEYLSEPLEGVKVWESGDRTYRYSPKRKRLSVALRKKSLEDQAREELRLLEENYSARVAGADDIAGRECWVVELRPRDPSNRWKRVWVDQETWVVLQSEDLEGSQPFRRTTFTTVQYLDPNQTLPDAEFEPPQALVERYGRGTPDVDPSDRFDDLKKLSKLVGFEVHAPRRLPKGYVFDGAYQIPCICGLDHRAVRLGYTDGLNRISLFEAGHPECLAPKRPLRKDSLAAQKITNGTYYWAYGDLPKEELQRIIDSAAGL